MRTAAFLSLFAPAFAGRGGRTVGRRLRSGGDEGRYLVDDDGLVGAEGDDPVAAELAALSVEALTARIAALPTPTG